MPGSGLSKSREREVSDSLPAEGRKLASPTKAKKAPVRAAIAHRGDYEFLPAALEILETPPSPVRMLIMATICAFVAAALGWSWFGRLDIIATAQGKVHPSGNVKVIQPLDTAKVVTIEIQNGRDVRAGDVLIRLDPSEAQADVAAASAALDAYEAECARRLAALKALKSDALTPPPAVAWDPSIPAATRLREERVLVADLSDLNSTIESLKAQADQKRAEQAGLRATIEAQKQLISTDQIRADMRSQLLRSGSGSKADAVNANETLQYQQMMLAQEDGQLAQSIAAQAVIGRNIQETFDKFLSDNAQKLEDAERQADDLRQKLTKARVVLSHMTLKSPIDGTVEALTVTTIGQVLTPGEEIMRIVPRNSDLDIEAYLPNEDRGFVKTGDKAAIKVATFPFTRYGTLPAHVVTVARDAVPEADATQQEADPFRPRQSAIVGGGQPTQNLVYPMTLRLERSTLNVDGSDVSITSGMAVTAEIRTGSRRILEYVFSPLVQTTSEAMKER